MGYLYNELATKLVQHIGSSVYRPGEKLPGVRSASQKQGVSPATVVAAYRQLELQGYIEARPRSGYYVSARPPSSLVEPEETAPAVTPQPVSGKDLVLRMLTAALQPDFVQLGAALLDTDFMPQKLVQKALISASQNSLQTINRYELPGILALRRQLAKYMASFQCTVKPDDIVVTNGCQEAVHLSLKVLTKPGDIVALESPTYYGLLQVIESLGLKALEIPTDPRRGISLDALRLAFEQWPVKACVVIPNFSNPLGSRMSDSDKRGMVQLANEFDVTIIEDDIYGDFSFDHRHPTAIKNFDEQDRVIYCSSFSKSIAPGLRIGWAVSARYQQQLAYQKFITNCAAPGINQLALTELLESGRYFKHLRDVQTGLAAAVAQMIDAVERYFPADTRVTRPTGGTVIWIELPKSVNAIKLANDAMENKISIAPGSLFTTSDKYNHCIRLSCAVSWSRKIEMGMKKLGELIRQQLKRPEDGREQPTAKQ